MGIGSIFKRVSNKLDRTPVEDKLCVIIPETLGMYMDEHEQVEHQMLVYELRLIWYLAIATINEQFCESGAYNVDDFTEIALVMASQNETLTQDGTDIEQIIDEFSDFIKVLHEAMDVIEESGTDESAMRNFPQVMAGISLIEEYLDRDDEESTLIGMQCMMAALSRASDVLGL